MFAHHISLPSSLSHRDLGLFAGAMPLGKRSRRGRTASTHGIHGGHKALGLPVFESYLERDFHTRLCADPRVKAYAVQSHQLTYWIPNESGAQTSHRYTPDVCVLLANDKRIVFEVRHSALLVRNSWPHREEHIRRAYERDHAVAFRIVTEREIRIQPLLSNCEMMLRFSHPRDDAEADAAVRDALSSLSTDFTIGRVCETALLRQNRMGRAYSGILRLALLGEIKLDLNVPLSLATTIKHLPSDLQISRAN